MAIYDISLPIGPSLPVWPGDPPVRLSQPAHLDRGDEYTLTRLDISAHTGTHLDAPAHFIPRGATVEALDLEVLMGPCRVVEVTEPGHVTAAVLDALVIPRGVARLLLKTTNSRLWAEGGAAFREDFVAVTADGAQWLVDHGIRLVGVDYLSVAPFDDGAAIHRLLLGAGVVVVEGLDLRAVAPGDYQLICLPLKIVGSEGAPARAVLLA